MNIYKIALTSTAQNVPNIAWRPGSARTRWGELTALPRPLAELKGPTSKGRGGGWEEGEENGGEEERRGKEGKGRGKGGEGPMSLSLP